MTKIISSILIPAYNSEKFIRPTIESVLNQDFDEEAYEIVVVDDGSKDATVKVLESFKGKFKNFSVIVQKNLGPAVALTTALKKAKGDYLFLMSHDCRAERYWLKEVVTEFEKDPRVAIVQGKLLPTKPIDLPVFHCNNFSTFQVTFDTAEVAYRKKAVEKAGSYFRDDFSTNGHDADMAWRIIEKGYKYSWIDKTLMYHDVLPRKFWADAKSLYLMQYFPKLLKIHPGMKQFIPFGFVWASLFKYALLGGVLTSILLLLSKHPLISVVVIVFTLMFSLLRLFRSTKNYEISLQQKVLVMWPHRIIGEALLGFFLIYGSMKYRNLVI